MGPVTVGIVMEALVIVGLAFIFLGLCAVVLRAVVRR
jgi:hypothetical protein